MAYLKFFTPLVKIRRAVRDNLDTSKKNGRPLEFKLTPRAKPKPGVALAGS